MTGKQISGIKKRSSEALLHLEIYRQRPDVKSVVAKLEAGEADAGIIYITDAKAAGAKLTAAEFGAYAAGSAQAKALSTQYMIGQVDGGNADAAGFIAFADPFQTHNESWLSSWNTAFPGIPTVGGLAGDIGGNASQLYLNGSVHEDGVVLVGFSGEIILPPGTVSHEIVSTPQNDVLQLPQTSFP